MGKPLFHFDHHHILKGRACVLHGLKAYPGTHQHLPERFKIRGQIDPGFEPG